MDSQVSSVQRHGDVTKTRKRSSLQTNKSLPSPVYDDQIHISNDASSSAIEFSSSQSQSDNSMTTPKSQSVFKELDNNKKTIQYHTSYPSFLPEDFTVDETVDVIDQTTGLLNSQELSCVETIAKKLNGNLSNLNIELSEDEETFIR